jgi:hypothetical protein
VAYFVMVGEGTRFDVDIDEAPDLPGGPWYLGQPLKIPLPEVLEYTLDVKKPWVDEDGEQITPPSNPSVLYNSEAYPLIRKDLLAILKSVGVDNLETFPARITDHVNDIVYDDYVAFNIIGLIAAADLSKSTLMPHMQEATLLDTDFDSLVIDPSKAMGLLLFRLAESCSAIVVNESVKNAVESKGVPGIVFYADGEWAG